MSNFTIELIDDIKLKLEKYNKYQFASNIINDIDYLKAHVLDEISSRQPLKEPPPPIQTLSDEDLLNELKRRLSHVCYAPFS